MRERNRLRSGRSSTALWLVTGLVAVALIIGIAFCDNPASAETGQAMPFGAFVQIEGEVFFELGDKLYTERELSSLLLLHLDVVRVYKEQIRLSDQIIIPALRDQIVFQTERVATCQKAKKRAKWAMCLVCGVPSGLAGFGIGEIQGD